MNTRTRIIRPLFYESTIIFGVRARDWIYVGIAAFAAFAAALIFKWQIYGVHLAPPLAIFTGFAGISFFNWVRKNHRPHWLEHQFSFQCRRLLLRDNNLKRLSAGELSRQKDWLIRDAEKSGL